MFKRTMRQSDWRVQWIVLAAIGAMLSGPSVGWAQFPFGHETNEIKGIFSDYYPFNVWPPEVPTLADNLFCAGGDQGWIVFYAYQWHPSNGYFNMDGVQFTALKRACTVARQDLGLIPVVRLHFMAHHTISSGREFPGWRAHWPNFDPPPAPNDSAWSVPPGQRTGVWSSSFSNPYQNVKSAFVDWCADLARSMRSECRWFIIGNETNMEAEYGDTGIVPADWYADVWSNCFFKMARNTDNYIGFMPEPTECQALVSPVTPHAEGDGSKWEKHLEKIAEEVDSQYRALAALCNPPGGLPDLKPGYAVHIYPDVGGADCSQLDDYINAIEAGSDLADNHRTEYFIDEYNGFFLDDFDDYTPGRITMMLNAVSQWRGDNQQDNLRGACYFAYHAGPEGDVNHDLVVEPNPPTQPDWTISTNRNLDEAYYELQAYGCPVGEWEAYSYQILPVPPPSDPCGPMYTVGVLGCSADGNDDTSFAVVYPGVEPCGLSGPILDIRLRTRDGQPRPVESVRFTMKVDSPVTNAGLTVYVNGYTEYLDVASIIDGQVFEIPLSAPPQSASELWVEVSTAGENGSGHYNNPIGFREIEVIGP